MTRRTLWLVLLLVGFGTAPADEPAAKSRPRYEVVVLNDERIVARDGTKLAADVYLPSAGGAPIEGRLPTLLCRTPYDKRRGGDVDTAKWFAVRGYAVVVNDCRGRFASEGHWRMLLDDPADGADVMKW